MLLSLISHGSVAMLQPVSRATTAKVTAMVTAAVTAMVTVTKMATKVE